MTACVDNNQKKGRTAKAVSATLAGVLAVGMVPAAAFAEPATDDAASDGVELLDSNAQSLESAAAKQVILSNGAAIADPSNIQIELDSIAAGTELELHSITWGDGSILSDDAENGHSVQFVLKGYGTAMDNGKGDHYDYGDGTYYATKSLSALTDSKDAADLARVGKTIYAAYQIQGGDYNGQYFYLPFKVVGKSLDNAFLIENGNISDTTFNWTGKTLDLGVAINDTALAEGTDYTIAVYKDGTTETAPNDLSSSALSVGGYTAVITGTGVYTGSTAKCHFTVDALDLSQVTAFVKADAFSEPDVPGTVSADSKIQAMYINGSEIDKSLFGLKYVSGPSGVGTVAELGDYTYEIVPTNSPAFENCVANTSKEVTLSKVSTILGTPYYFKYANGNFRGTVINTDYNSLNPNLFDENDVHVYKTTSGQTVANELPFTLKVYDQYYNEVSIDSLKTSGTWYVYVSVDSAAVDYAFGGMSGALTVNVQNANIPDANVVYAYDGQHMSTVDSESYEVTYDGSNLLDNVSTQVKDSKGNVLTEGEDYQVVVKDENGKIVDQIVDAGTYTIDVTSDTYNFTGDHDAKLIVNPARIASLDVTNTVKFGDSEFLDYTGEAITPEFAYSTDSTPTASQYLPLPSVYDMEIWKADAVPTFDAQGYPEVTVNANGVVSVDKDIVFTQVDEVKDEGFYIFVLGPDEDAEGVSNFLFDMSADNGTQMPWTWAKVSDQGVFSDVPTEHWAAQYIYTASEEGYVNGYAGTTYFGPNNEILRGEAATILFRMAGGNEISSSILQQILAQPMPFSDVESGMYYTAPVIWASSAHIVNGYDSTGMFAPNGDITREEFATMLYRYAKATDQLGDAEAGNLADYVDGSSVSDWAKEAMEWATGAGIMNGYGDTGVLGPQNTITRAEACKMMVELQPETLTDMFSSNTPILP